MHRKCSILIFRISSEVVEPKGVQVPNIQALWSQIPLRAWILEPETSNIRYLGLSGEDMSSHVELHMLPLGMLHKLKRWCTTQPKAEDGAS